MQGGQPVKTNYLHDRQAIVNRNIFYTVFVDNLGFWRNVDAQMHQDSNVRSLMRFAELYNLELHLMTKVEHEKDVKPSLQSLGSASIQPRKSHLKVNVPLLVRISCTICRNKRLVHTVISCQFSRLIGVQSQTCQSCQTCPTCYVVPSRVAASRVVPSSSVSHQGI